MDTDVSIPRRQATKQPATDPTEARPTKRQHIEQQLIAQLGVTKQIKLRDTDHDVLLNEEPTDITDSINQPNDCDDYPPDLLMQGITDEVTSLLDFDVYQLRKTSECTTKPVSTRWVHRWKNDTVKSRLVV